MAVVVNLGLDRSVDESTYVNSVAQLAIFIRGVDKCMKITEEFVGLIPMTDTTTANDIFNCLVKSLDQLGVNWSWAVSVTTDRAPSMCKKEAGVASKLREKVKSCGGVATANHLSPSIPIFYIFNTCTH
ncbi:hypothetical protein QTP86_002671 [Hemibagrus guttatus]|nr:hypothetical protein QTP86_002671 [Hemibagrus guttatus]